MRLAVWREREGISQEELARRAGVSRATVIAVEQRGALTVRVAQAIERATGGAVRVRDLIPDAKAS
jgi:transcriptional regulator with XRE-family HTH domain